MGTVRYSHVQCTGNQMHTERLHSTNHLSSALQTTHEVGTQSSWPCDLYYKTPCLRVEIRPSLCGGLGVYAVHPIQKGDIITVYSGERFRDVRQWQCRTGCTASPYAIRLAQSDVVIDAASFRSIGATINQATSVKACNAFFVTGTLHKGRFVQATGKRWSVLNKHCGYRNSGIRTVPGILLHHFCNENHPWVVAKQNINPGDEILVWYDNDAICDIEHKTERASTTVTDGRIL